MKFPASVNPNLGSQGLQLWKRDPHLSKNAHEIPLSPQLLPPALILPAS
jgi:hypothetical protein